MMNESGKPLLYKNVKDQRRGSAESWDQPSASAANHGKLV
jgi:hypothetical protein